MKLQLYMTWLERTQTSKLLLNTSPLKEADM